MRNFHLPLADETSIQLRAEAERTNVPAPILAREAITLWLKKIGVPTLEMLRDVEEALMAAMD